MVRYCKPVDFLRRYRLLQFRFLQSSSNGSVRINKPKNRHRNRGYAIEEMANMSESEFAKMFRMSRDSFNDLELQLDPILTFE